MRHRILFFMALATAWGSFAGVEAVEARTARHRRASVDAGSAPRPSRAAKVRSTAKQVAQALRRFRHEPCIRRVQRAAIGRANVSAGLARRWLRRVRRAAWLPSLQLGAGAHVRRDKGLDQKAGTADLFQEGAANQITYEIKLSWDLPRLIFDPNELKVIREAQRIAELRDQIVAQVTRLYFERRRLQLLEVLRPVLTPRAALRRQLRIAELTALLNSLTGGLFRAQR